MNLNNDYQYYVYITTNAERTVLDTGVTGDLRLRIQQLEQSQFQHPLIRSEAKPDCIYLVYWESFDVALDAINRERKVKGYSRRKKKTLVVGSNPEWEFLNERIYEQASW